MRLFYKNIEKTKVEVELIGNYNNKLLYDPIYNKWKMDKDFLFIAYPYSVNRNADVIHIFLAPEKLRLKENRSVLTEGNNLVALVNPSISKKLLEAFKLNVLEGRKVKLYLNKKDLKNYLFLIVIKLKGIYLTYIKDNFLYIENKGNDIKLEVNKLNLREINRLIPHDTRVYKDFEIILT